MPQGQVRAAPGCHTCGVSEHVDPVVPNPTSAVNPSQASLAELAGSDVDGPIAMLNLLRYDGVEGRVAYGRYAQVAGNTIAAVGGSLMYLGTVIESDAWDSIALIYYPSAQAYLAMQDDPDYVEAIPDRTAGLRARLLFPFALPHINGQGAAGLAECGDAEVMEAQLIELKSPAPALDRYESRPSTNATAPLRLHSVGSGLVTDRRWDQLVLRRIASDEGKHPGHHTQRGSDPNISDLAVVLSQPVVPT